MRNVFMTFTTDHTKTPIIPAIDYDGYMSASRISIITYLVV